MAATEQAAKTFKVGNTYSCRSVCDHDCIWTFTVQSRTTKFVTLLEAGTDDVRRVGVKVWRDAESCLPFGSFSMAPSLRAD